MTDRAGGPLDPPTEARRDVQMVLESWLVRAAEEGNERAAADLLKELAAPQRENAAHAREALASEGTMARERDTAGQARGAERGEEALSAQRERGASSTCPVPAVDAIWRAAAADALASRHASVALGLDVTGAGDLAWLD